MSGASLPPLDLTLNKSLLQDKLRCPAGTKKHTAPLLSTEQISLLLSLLAIGVYQKAEAQGTEAELIFTAQNNFGEVTQLILSGASCIFSPADASCNLYVSPHRPIWLR